MQKVMAETRLVKKVGKGTTSTKRKLQRLHLQPHQPGETLGKEMTLGKMTHGKVITLGKEVGGETGETLGKEVNGQTLGKEMMGGG